MGYLYCVFKENFFRDMQLNVKNYCSCYYFLWLFVLERESQPGFDILSKYQGLLQYHIENIPPI